MTSRSQLAAIPYPPAARFIMCAAGLLPRNTVAAADAAP